MIHIVISPSIPSIWLVLELKFVKKFDVLVLTDSNYLYNIYKKLGITVEYMSLCTKPSLSHILFNSISLKKKIENIINSIISRFPHFELYFCVREIDFLGLYITHQFILKKNESNCNYLIKFFDENPNNESPNFPTPDLRNFIKIRLLNFIYGNIYSYLEYSDIYCIGYNKKIFQMVDELKFHGNYIHKKKEQLSLLALNNTNEVITIKNRIIFLGVYSIAEGVELYGKIYETVLNTLCYHNVTYKQHPGDASKYEDFPNLHTLSTNLPIEFIRNSFDVVISFNSSSLINLHDKHCLSLIMLASGKLGRKKQVISRALLSKNPSIEMVSSIQHLNQFLMDFNNNA